MTSEQQWNKAQRPIDFEAPDFAEWSPFDKATKSLKTDDLTEISYLARNTLYISKATRVILKRHRPLFFQDSGSSIIPPGAKLQCGIRLKRLLQYYRYVCQVCQEDAESVTDPQSSAGTQVELLKHDVVLTGTVIERLPPSWTNDLPAPQNDRYKAFQRNEKPFIPTEPMLELYTQLCIWIETQRPEAEVQNLRSENGVQLFLRSTMSMWSEGEKISTDSSMMGMSKCLFAAQSTKASIFAEANLVIGCTGARLPQKVGEFFDNARLSRFRGDSTDLSSRFDIELMRKWQPLRVDQKPEDDVITPETNSAFMKDRRTRASSKLCNSVMANLAGNSDSKIKTWDPDYRTWNALTITQASRQWLRDGEKDRAGKFTIPAVLDWSPFVWTDMTARSHFVMPGTVKGQKEWFTPIPRCSKCRTIHEYTVSTEQDGGMVDMLNYNEINRPLGCAEDIVHCKLRMLYPDNKAGAGKAEFAKPLKDAKNVGPNLSWYNGKWAVEGKQISDNGTWDADIGKVTWTPDGAKGTYDVLFSDGTKMSEHESKGLFKTTDASMRERSEISKREGEKKRQQVKAMKEEEAKKEEKGSNDEELGPLFDE